MGVYAYALVGGDVAGLGRGAWREPLRCVRCGPLWVIVGSRRDPPSLSPAGLKAHWAVIRRLFRGTDALLPFRFGTFLASNAALAKALRGESRSLEATLEKVRGAVQMTVRFQTPETAPPRTARGSGRAYLSSRLASLQWAQSAPELSPARRVLGSRVRDERVERTKQAVTVFHLVPRDEVAAYRRVWRSVSLPRALRLRVSGPFPVFAFGPDQGRLS